VNNKFVMHLKQYPYRNYAIGIKIKKGRLKPALWWDTGDYEVNKDLPPYHYVRTQPFNDSHDLLIVGGEDHATGLADAEKRPETERYHRLDEWARKNFAELEEKCYEWSGQVLEPFDSLGYIGQNPTDSKNIYIVTGDSGNGMTHGTIAGMLIRDLILQRNNSWEKIYSPSRFKLFNSGNIFLKELTGTITDYLKTKPKGKGHPIEDLVPGNGMIVEHQGKKMGAYRDEGNRLHFVEPECTHQGCLVKWNKDEKTWDCPCHGSRFSYEGKVMNGPANRPLAYHSEKLGTNKSN
jgi:Rieske Fe-S protein